MIGIEQFVQENINDHNSNFRACLELVIYSYCKIKEGKIYKRSEIQNELSKIRGKVNVQMELEDYLRHDLVEEYLEKNKRQFGLRHFLFQSGAEEFKGNVKVGILDIKVRSTLFDGRDYYIFECKRLNKRIKDKYITEGVVRFINRKYYPEIEMTLAGMIGFVEAAEENQSYNHEDIDSLIKDLIEKYKKTIRLKKGVSKHIISDSAHREVNNFKSLYRTTHRRANSIEDFDIYHLILDYNKIIQN